MKKESIFYMNKEDILRTINNKISKKLKKSEFIKSNLKSDRMKANAKMQVVDKIVYGAIAEKEKDNNILKETEIRAKELIIKNAMVEWLILKGYTYVEAIIYIEYNLTVNGNDLNALNEKLRG